MRSVKRSRGAALLVAMLIAAMVAVIATKVGSHYILSFRRSSNMLLSDQGYLFLLSAEALAKNVLIADDTTSDHLGEAWAQQVQPYVIEGGLLTGQIYDLQARFNINNLAQPATANPPTGQSSGLNFNTEQKMFIRLLRTFNEEGGIEVSVQQAQDITNAVADWLDPDSNPTGFNSAEDDYYADLDIPYRAANREMLSASELRLVKGMTAQLYKALLPHITALPGSTAVNTNTATENVLRSIKPSAVAGGEFEPQTLEEIQPQLEQREEQILAASAIGGASVDPATGQTNRQFSGQLRGGGSVSGSGSSGSAKTSENSNYFLFDGLVKLGDLTVPVRTVLNRDSGGTPGAAQGKVKVIRRSLGSL